MLFQNMAAHLGIAAQFQFSHGLFCKEGTSPYRFYYENESDDLRGILRKGLGHLVSDPAEADILLCDKKTDNRITQGYLPLDFIVDCVKRNTFLDMDNYRANVLGLKASASKDESFNAPGNSTDDSEEERNLVLFSPPRHIQVKSDGLLGRKKYSDLDDFKIINYLMQHKKYTETGGNTVWKQMELVKITDHSYQSMRARFSKKILPNIDTYEIPENWKAKLRGDCADDSDEETNGDAETNGDVTFSYLDRWSDQLKQSSNKKQVQRRSSSAGSSSKTAANESTPAASPLNADSSAANSCVNAVANLNASDLEPLADINSETLAQGEAEIDNETNDDSGNLVQSALYQSDVSAGKEQRTCSQDYVYDDLDILILSEAKKYPNADCNYSGASKTQDSHSADKSHSAAQKHQNLTDTYSNQSSDISVGVTTRRKSKAINHSSCVENPPANSLQPYNNTENRDTQTNKVTLNIHYNSVNTTSSSESEDGDEKNHKISGRQNGTSDKMIGVSEEHVNSINTILNVIKEGSVTSNLPKTAYKKVATRKGSVRNSASDFNDSVEETSLHIKSPMPNRRSNNVSPVASSSGVHASTMRQEKGRMDSTNVNKSLEKSMKAPTELAANRKASLNKSSCLDNGVDETTEQHTDSSSATSSKPRKRTIQSNESDDSSSVSFSPCKRKRVQPRKLTRPSAESTRLDNSSRVSPQTDKSSKLFTKEETMSRVMFISEAYDLEIKEAALLLRIHNGSFLSAIKYLDSL